MGSSTYLTGDMTIHPRLFGQHRADLENKLADVGLGHLDDAGVIQFDETAGYHWQGDLADVVTWLFDLGYRVNGGVDWDGDESEDFGVLSVADSVLSLEEGYRSYHDPAVFYRPVRFDQRASCRVDGRPIGYAPVERDQTLCSWECYYADDRRKAHS